jgi:hypothetical protein
MSATDTVFVTTWRLRLLNWKIDRALDRVCFRFTDALFHSFRRLAFWIGDSSTHVTLRRISVMMYEICLRYYEASLLAAERSIADSKRFRGQLKAAMATYRQRLTDELNLPEPHAPTSAEEPNK